MNKSERLHNQRNEKHITPELKLSMELRDTCERLLQEKGKNKLALEELLLQVLQPLGIIRALATRTMPQNLVRGKIVDLKELKGETKSKPDARIACSGTNPSKAKSIGIYVQSMQDALLPYVGTRALILERQQPGKIVDQYFINYRFFDNNEPKQKEKRLATVEELEAHQRYINQSVPIESK